jgi:hypothetical protein
MPAFLTARFEVWSEIWTEIRHGKEAKIMTGLYAGALFIYGLLTKFYPALIERAQNVPAVAALLSLRTWIILALLIILFLTLEGAYRVVAKRDKAHKETLAEAQSHNLTFILDCEPFRSEVGLEDYSDDEDDHNYCISAILKMHFINNDVHPVLVRRISLSIVRDAGTIETWLPDNRFPVTWKSATAENTYFRGLQVPASTPTEDYWFHCRAEVPRQLNEQLKPGADLRVTMDASRQKPYFVDLVINWRAAEGNSTSIIAFRSTLDRLSGNSD